MEQYYQTILGASIALISSIIILVLSNVLQGRRERRTRENEFRATRITEVREAIVKVHDFICKAEYNFSDLDTNRENFKLLIQFYMDEMAKIKSIIVPSYTLFKPIIYERILSFIDLATEVINKIREAEDKRFEYVGRHMDKYVLDAFTQPNDKDKASIENRLRNDNDWQIEMTKFRKEIQEINRRASLAYGKLINDIDLERLK